MPVTRHEFPILEYDTEPHGIIRPNRKGLAVLPGRCVMTFFREVLDEYVAAEGLTELSAYNSENGRFPVYRAERGGVEFCVVQAQVGSAAVATMADFLFGYGVKTLIACGGCGVLEDVPAGDVIVPTSALRDEGASYHYLPPSREIELDEKPVEAIRRTLEKHNTPYVLAKTWTTDAFYRETPDMVAYRRAEGCAVVEMECAALTAVARFRGASFGQLLYSGDYVADDYDERGWSGNTTARGRLFTLALEAILSTDLP